MAAAIPSSSMASRDCCTHSHTSPAHSSQSWSGYSEAAVAAAPASCTCRWNPGQRRPSGRRKGAFTRPSWVSFLYAQ
eukprot:1735607-Lingulodinium_polyedra.AAC.1